jgi:predicted flap endonuclease-1-like 5' DNA nuclease
MKACSVFIIGVLVLIAGLALGLLFGWVIWPVQWTDASPVNLRFQWQTDWVNMSIDSYSVNQNAALAAQRFAYLGKDGPLALASVLKNPEWVSESDAMAYKDALVSQIGEGVYAETATVEKTSSLTSRLLKPPLFGYIAVAFFLALLALVLLVILVFRLIGGGRKETPTAAEASVPAAAVTLEEPGQVGESVAEPLAEGEVQAEESGISPVAAAVAGAAVAGAATAMRSEEEPELVEAPVEEALIAEETTPPAEIAEEPAPLETTSELPVEGAARAVTAEGAAESDGGIGLGTLAVGAAAVAGIISHSKKEDEQPETGGAAVVAEEAAGEAQAGETTGVVQAVEEVASGEPPFGGVVDTVQGAIVQEQVPEKGGLGTIGKIAAGGAAAAGIEWALEREPEAETKVEEAVEPEATPELPAEPVAAEMPVPTRATDTGEWVPEIESEGQTKEFFGKYNRKVIDIEGVGEVYAAKLAEVGITTTHAYLQQCSTTKGRDELAEKTGISKKFILEWANHADLMRIQGIGPQWSDLLEMAGVNTVREMALRNGANLYQKLVEINDEKKLVRQLPTTAQVEDWIEQAKELPRILTY